MPQNMLEQMLSDERAAWGILVDDLEATYWAGESPTPPEGVTYSNEIIEVGAVLVDVISLEEVSRYQSFVRPQVNYELTGFCKKLTHIRQSDVDGARPWPEVSAEFRQRFRLGTDEEPLFTSWGNHDRKQFESDCERHHLPALFAGGNHWNLKKAVAKAFDIKPMGIGRMLEQLGMTFVGDPHRGIDDALNATRLLRVAADKSRSRR